MAKQAFPPLIAVTLCAFACGCATTADHPSLAPRTIERFTAAEPIPVLPPPPIVLPDDASRQQQAAALAARARAADDRFRAGFAEAEAAVDRGSASAPGSEAWARAEQALSRAESLREPVSDSLAELDALQIAAVETGVGAEAGAALAASLRDVMAIAARQRDAIAALRERIARP